ncbi:non-ribosomal peptide synthetase [Clostridium felsineum]|uniref:non-ribosomal peptide synthetase n=1 Tax=Clostridium felsineum TaxID=36839 RepID=UPI0009CC1589|nr:non-ribosomal peptide synthetase [Clostridium felsineum]URZ02607.1 Anguibactin system regulator [Clostridium felsineum]
MEYSTSEDTFPLSNVQKAYYLGRNSSFELGGFSTQIQYIFKCHLDPIKFEEVINKLIVRQSMLRAIILNANEQKILEKVPHYNVKVIDVSDYSLIKKKDVLKKESDNLFNKIYVANRWPLFDFEFVKFIQNEKYFLANFDLLIADGASLMLLAKEISEYYNKDIRVLPQLEKTYKEYILGKTFKIVKSKKYIRDKDYWMQRIDDIPFAPKIPLNNKVISKNMPTVKRITVNIKSDIWTKIKEKAKSYNISPTSIVLVAYIKVLGYWCDEKRFTLNVTITEKLKYKMQNVIGDFTSTLLLPVEEESYNNDSFWEDAKQIMKIFTVSYKHNSFDGIDVIKEISKRKELGTSAIMPIVFTSMLFKNDLFDDIYKIGELVESISRTSQVLLDCQAEESKGNLVVTFDYIKDYVDEASIIEMTRQFEKIFYYIDNNQLINSRVLALSSLYSTKWFNYNNTKINYKKNLLIDLLKESILKYPNKIAISDDENEITYKKLNQLSNKVALKLLNDGLKPKDFVGVSTDRTMSTIINIVAVLKVGAAYVPIQYDFPDERKKYIFKKSNCKCLLQPFNVSNEILNNNIKDIWSCGEGKDCAYVIFTSGSTGNPKGVAISNKSISNTIQDINKKFQVTNSDKFILLSSMCFDLSVYDIFGALSSGAELFIPSNPKDVKQLMNRVEEKKITVWNSVPSMCELLFTVLDYNYVNNNMRLMLLSGDWIPNRTPELLQRYFPKSNIVSLGGATEASIWSIFYKIDKFKNHTGSIPYGYPLGNQQIYILDKYGRICPPMVKGEIFIGGVGVAIGYIDNEEKTHEAFINHKQYGRIYKTGDYGVFSHEGYVRILGRIDDQIKIRGYRIELGEIELVALKFKGIEKVIVQANKENTYLNMYIETKDNIDIEALKQFMNTKLPYYMMPNNIIQMRKFPLNMNGKIDKKALPKISDNKECKMPRNEKEKVLTKIWMDVFQVKEISINENFFSLGGDSLKATKIVFLLEKAGWSINMSDLYKNNTIESLAKCLKSNKDEEEKVKIEEECGEI